MPRRKRAKPLESEETSPGDPAPEAKVAKKKTAPRKPRAKKEKPAPPPAEPDGEETVSRLPPKERPTSTGIETETAIYRLVGAGGELSLVEASLIVIAHPDPAWLGNRFRIEPGEEVEIGRAPENRVCLPNVGSVSRRHAKISHRGHEIRLSDLGSTNGTLVNDRWVEGHASLESGDRFQVGEVHFKVLHEKDIENAYHRTIYELVTTDGLTGIANRRKYEEEAEREFARARRYGRPLSLILFDIDHFKRLNDACGHLCGDFVLQHLSRTVKSCLRREEILARVGGEEFAVLAPETDGRGARRLAERIRSRLESDIVQWADREIGVTCSFGVAEIDRGMATAVDLYERSDRALYASKAAGRNRVTLAKP